MIQFDTSGKSPLRQSAYLSDDELIKLLEAIHVSIASANK